MEGLGIGSELECKGSMVLLDFHPLRVQIFPGLGGCLFELAQERVEIVFVQLQDGCYEICYEVYKAQMTLAKVQNGAFETS